MKYNEVFRNDHFVVNVLIWKVFLNTLLYVKKNLIKQYIWCTAIWKKYIRSMSIWRETHFYKYRMKSKQIDKKKKKDISGW